jgi:hypothetical protein
MASDFSVSGRKQETESVTAKPPVTAKSPKSVTAKPPLAPTQEASGDSNGASQKRLMCT